MIYHFGGQSFKPRATLYLDVIAKIVLYSELDLDIKIHFINGHHTAAITCH